MIQYDDTEGETKKVGGKTKAQLLGMICIQFPE